MCFTAKLIREAYKEGREVHPDLPISFFDYTRVNAFIFPDIAIIKNETPNLLMPAKWGLIPHWSKEDNIKKYTLNARIETLKEKPSFRDAVSKRCIIPCSAFYEWQWLDAKGRNKQQYEIGLREGKPFYLAGLWNDWNDRQKDKTTPTFTVVTTKANKLMAQIHNTKKRMPVILTQASYKAWLEGKDTEEFIENNPDLKAEKVE